MDSNAKRLKSARACIGRAYRSVENAMSLMSPIADTMMDIPLPNVTYAIAQLMDALDALRGFDPCAGVTVTDYPVDNPLPTDWYLVDYSLPKSAQCPTGRESLRVLAYSDADAVARTAIILEGRGLEFRARINFARRDLARKDAR
jgi:hypothetical protein